MLAVLAAIAFAVATILHLLHGDPYWVWALVFGGLTLFALYCVYPYNVVSGSTWIRRRPPR